MATLFVVSCIRLEDASSPLCGIYETRAEAIESIVDSVSGFIEDMIVEDNLLTKQEGQHFVELVRQQLQKDNTFEMCYDTDFCKNPNSILADVAETYYINQVSAVKAPTGSTSYEF